MKKSIFDPDSGDFRFNTPTQTESKSKIHLLRALTNRENALLVQ
jgi:hypothetical protein